MTINANSPQDYINQIPEDRREVVSKIREIILSNLPKGYEETMQYNMLSYVVPKSIYPNGYHCNPKDDLPFISFASQKNFIALYHMGIYANEELLNWFTTEYPKHCKTKLDMGKSCIRFKKMDDIPFDLIKELVQKVSVQDWIETYEKNVKR
jgi:uncharacterized protein YdhG (YjbR/CyaY superfamily)